MAAVAADYLQAYHYFYGKLSRRTPPLRGRLQRLVPRLPGCWSQGTTEEEALVNIQIAIKEYVAAAEEFRF